MCNLFSRWPGREDISQLWVFLVSVTSCDVCQYACALGKIYDPSEIQYKYLGACVFLESMSAAFERFPKEFIGQKRTEHE